MLSVAVSGLCPFGFTLALLTLSGCAAAPTATDTVAAPPDFCLVLTYHPARGAGNIGLRQPAHFVVEADGTLRAAVGPGVDPGLMPPVTARLSPPQRDRLWNLVRDARLVDPDPKLEAGDPRPPFPLLQPLSSGLSTTVMAHGRTHRHATPAPLNPGQAALLRFMVELRGG